MSVIIHCKPCRTRIKDQAAPCPACGALERQFYIDYFPSGRNGRRVRQALDPAIQDLEAARLYDQGLRAAALESRRTVVADKPPETATVGDLFADYLEWCQIHRAKLTHRDVMSVYENHLRRHFGPIPVLTLNRHHMTAYQHLRRGTQVANRTINKELDYFRGFLRWCRHEKRLEIGNVEYEPLPARRRVPIVLSPREVAAIIEAAEPFYAAFFIFLYTMGLRRAEAQNIKLKDIDVENRQIRVLQKGGSYKMLPINEWAAAAMAYLKGDRLTEAGAREEYLFASRRGGGKKPIQNVRRAIERACKRAGVTKYVYPHLLRHSFATHLMAGGVNIRMIQTLLGHVDRRATEFYTHVSIDHLRDATDRLFPSVSTDNMLKNFDNQATSLRQDL